MTDDNLYMDEKYRPLINTDDLNFFKKFNVGNVKFLKTCGDKRYFFNGIVYYDYMKTKRLDSINIRSINIRILKINKKATRDR